MENYPETKGFLKIFLPLQIFFAGTMLAVIYFTKAPFIVEVGLGWLISFIYGWLSLVIKIRSIGKNIADFTKIALGWQAIGVMGYFALLVTPLFLFNLNPNWFILTALSAYFLTMICQILTIRKLAVS